LVISPRKFHPWMSSIYPFYRHDSVISNFFCICPKNVFQIFVLNIYTRIYNSYNNRERLLSFKQFSIRSIYTHSWNSIFTISKWLQRFSSFFC
jgi:hypothetical protein